MNLSLMPVGPISKITNKEDMNLFKYSSSFVNHELVRKNITLHIQFFVGQSLKIQCGYEGESGERIWIF